MSQTHHGDSYLSSRIDVTQDQPPKTLVKQNLQNLILNSTMLVNNEKQEYENTMKSLND